MDKLLNDILDELLLIWPELTPEQRLKVKQKLFDEYCQECGFNYKKNCKCWDQK